MGAHRHAFTVGFISMMIMGVAARVVPILAGVDANKLSGLWGPFLLITIGNSGRVLLQIGTDFFPNVAYPLVGLTGFLEVTALALWGIGLWRVMDLSLGACEGTLRPIPDPRPVVGSDRTWSARGELRPIKESQSGTIWKQGQYESRVTKLSEPPFPPLRCGRGDMRPNVVEFAYVEIVHAGHLG